MLRCQQCGAATSPSDRFCAACGARVEVGSGASNADPLIGRTVGGSYLLQELIGVGGMGRVYRGVQNALNRTVAVKVIHPHLLNDEQTVARFYNEAKAASRLNHPDSVGIIDFGRTDDGILYLVMEHLSGKDLAQVLTEEGPLPFKRIVRILRRVCSALGEAHALNVIHRDLKPENVIVLRGRRGEDSVKVVDFGLATITGPQATSITTPGLVCGTPDYMSPEQGRGDGLDARSDLYSMGVLLFEMLTDRLPYVDDTPTKVVLRHIQDPIPDPRQVAPTRGIPSVLADIAMRCLQKDAKDRYQNADELEEALRRAEEVLDARESEVKCPTCGAANTATSRFCSECGTRLSPTAPQPTPAALQRTSTAPPVPRQALVGRESELAIFDNARRAPTLGWIAIAGEPGVGKTRLVREWCARAESQDDLVVTAGPHPSWAPVPYWAIRTVLAGLFEVDESKLAEVPQSYANSLSKLEIAGLREVIDPRGIPGFPGRSRARAVGHALAAGIARQKALRPSRKIVIAVEDLPRCDALTADAITALADLPAAGDQRLAETVVITTQTSPRDRVSRDRAKLVELTGLTADEAQAFLTGSLSTAPRTSRAEFATADKRYLPLYLEQIRALGGMTIDDDALPARLADAAMQRLSRLDLGARRTLQAAAVLGERASLDSLRELVPQRDLGPIDVLTRLGLLRVAGDEVRFSHPLVRELVESSIPSEARKELHIRALALAAQAGSPLEVRAEHAWKGGEAMSAILLFERMGDGAMTRGDAPTAILAYRRGLEVARRESLEAGDESLTPAVVSFSRKLAEALDAVGDASGADGVLREAMELVGPESRDRGRMLLLLGRIGAHRDRLRDAVRSVGQAIEIARSNRDKRGELDAQLELGRLRRRERDLAGARGAFEQATKGLDSDQSADPSAAAALLEIGELLLEEGDVARAETHFLAAAGRLRSADGASAPSGLLAAIIAKRAEARRRAGDRDLALGLYREASVLAAEAGDAENARSFETAAAG